MFGASNELPDGKELEALFDRFLLRFDVPYLLQPANLRTVLLAPEPVPTVKLTMADLRKPPPTVAEFSKEFLEGFVLVNNKPSSYSTKKSILDAAIVPFFGKMRLDEIGPRELERFKSKLLVERKLLAKTVNNYLSVLRRMLTLAVEWKLITHVPPVKWMKCPPPEFDFLDFKEAERLVAAADGEWRATIIMGLTTGLRLGELLALRWEDVDLVAGRLMVRRAVARGIIGTPKNGRTRELPLSEDLRRVLKAHRHLRGELVFCTMDGRMFKKGETRHPLWRGCKRAGLRQIGWHCLRHTFASHLVMRGAPIKAVQELLGHSTIEMTMRYSHLSPDVRRDAVLLLDGNGYGNLTATEAKTSTRGRKLRSSASSAQGRGVGARGFFDPRRSSPR